MTKQTIKNPYKLLQVDNGASYIVIKAAYRALIKQSQNHPDLGGDLKSAQELNEAYEILTNKKKRFEFDQSISTTKFRNNTIPGVVVYCLQCHEVNRFSNSVGVKWSFCSNCGHPFVETENNSNTKVDSEPIKIKDPVEFILFLYNNRLYSRAIEQINTFLKNEKNDAEMLYFLGMCYYNMFRYKESSRILLKNTQLNKDHYLSYLYLGKSLMQQRQFMSAIPHLKKASNLRQEYLKPKVVLANCLFQCNKYSEASKCFEDILKIDPINEQAYFLLGVSVFKQGNIKKSRDILERGSSQFPNSNKFKQMLKKIRNFS